MPFLAIRDGTEVLPHQAEKGDDLACPTCECALKIRRSHSRDGAFVARHFYHNTVEDVECGGESPPHKRMKSIAYSKLLTSYPEATIALEEPLGSRKVDILVDFGSPRYPTGKGIGVEVQHKHRNKDREAVSEEYHSHGYSVLWLEQEDFDGFDVDLSVTRPMWPHGVQHDFSGGYHGIIQWLRQSKPAQALIEVKMPREYFEEKRENVRRRLEDPEANSNEKEGWTALGFWWLSASYQPSQRWLKLTETPDGYPMLQLGKQDPETEVVIAPVQTESSANRGKVHSLAYEVAEDHPNSGEWEDIEKVWLESGLDSTSVLLKLSSTNQGNLALSLGKFREQDGTNEFVSVPALHSTNLKEGLHELANLLG